MQNFATKQQSKQRLTTITDRDVLVFPRTAIPLILAAHLVFQSVVPCCAIGKLLADGDSSVAVATHVSHACSCCPHSKSQQESVPSDDDHSPDGECPYCGGLLFHSGLDDAAPISDEGHAVFALFVDAQKHVSGQVRIFPQIFPRQVLGQPFLNTGMRLLI
ncbi:MAG: hypothetical protein AAF802_00320 [Planctomycetota bacterium]